MDRADQLSALGGIAADQWGLVTAAQAKAAGLNGVQLLRLAESGLLENVGRGVYLLVAAGPPQHLHIKVAWLRLQPAVAAWERNPGDPDSGVVSHASACQVSGLGDIPTPTVEISVPRRRVTTDSFVRLRTAELDAADVTLVDGLPVTRAHRTVIDLLRTKRDGGHVGGVIAEAARRDLLSVDELADDVSRFAHRYGLPRGADGHDLVEHLVQQAGESLRSRQIERAAQEGFTTALQLVEYMRSDTVRDLPQHEDAVAFAQETIKRWTPGVRSAHQTAAVQAALRDVLPQMPSPVTPALLAALRSFTPQQTQATAAVQALLRGIAPQLPPPLSPEALKALHRYTSSPRPPGKPQSSGEQEEAGGQEADPADAGEGEP